MTTNPFDDVPEDDALPPAYVPFLADLIEHTRKMVRKHDQLPPLAFLMRGGKLAGPVLAAEFPDDRAKDYFAETVRQAASRHRADGIAMVSETWTLPAVDREEFERNRDKYKQIADHPNRVDSVMVKLETVDGDWIGVATIEPGQKGRKMGALRWMKPDGSAGRFSHLLPVQYATPAQVDAFVELIRAALRKAGVDPDYRFSDTGRTVLEPVIRHARQAPAKMLTQETADQMAACIAEFFRNIEDE